ASAALLRIHCSRNGNPSSDRGSRSLSPCGRGCPSKRSAARAGEELLRHHAMAPTPHPARLPPLCGGRLATLSRQGRGCPSLRLKAVQAPHAPPFRRSSASLILS